MALKGNLRDVSLANLISVVCNDRGRARLQVVSPQGAAVLFLADGNVVHAEMGSHTGEEVVFRVLGWTEGEFELEQSVAAPTVSISSPLSSLLLQGMQRLDEGTSGADATDPGPANNTELLCKSLAAVEGVSGVVIVARDGTVLAHSLTGAEGDVAAKQAEVHGAVSVFVGNAASEVGEVLGLGSVVSALIDRGAGQSRLMVMGEHDYWVGLELGNTASPAMVASRAKMLLD